MILYHNIGHSKRFLISQYFQKNVKLFVLKRWTETLLDDDLINEYCSVYPESKNILSKN